MEPRRYFFSIFADYFQFFVSDAAYDSDVELWTKETVDRMLGLDAGLIAVRTVRNMHVPLVVEIWAGAPSDDAEDWDQVIECGISVPSGALMVYGGTDAAPDEEDHIKVLSADHKARVSYGKLKDLWDDGLAGNDRYRVQLWPGAAQGVEIIKRHAGLDKTF